MPPNPAADKPARLSKHAAQQDDDLTQQLSTSRVTCPTFSLPRPWLRSPVPPWCPSDPLESWSSRKSAFYLFCFVFFFKPACFSAGWESWFVLWRDQTSTRPVKVQEKQLEPVAGMCAEEGEGTAPFWWQWAVRLTKLSRQTKPLEKIQLLVWKCLDRYSLFLSRRWIKIYQHKALYTHVTVSTWGVALV